jgi:hypothetical protein
MDLGRSKELRDYLQTTLKLQFVFPEPEEDPEFYEKVYTALKPLHTTLCNALESAYSDEKSLRALVKQYWEKDLGEIPNEDRYAERLRSTIEWMESDGCLLEFIAAAHSHKARNTKLNIFFRKNLFALLEPLVPAQQIPQSKLLPQSPLPPVDGSDGRANDRDSAISKGATGSEIKSLHEEVPDELPVLEENQGNGQTQPTPFPRKTIPIDNQLQEDPITSAYSRVHIAQEKMQSVYEIFQGGGKISEPPITESIEQAKQSIDGISDLFVNTPTPDYLELDYRLTCEERYICEKISIIATYSLHDAYISSSSKFRSADREFEKIFSGLRNLENFIKQFQDQIQLSAYTSNRLLENSP